MPDTHVMTIAKQTGVTPQQVEAVRSLLDEERPFRSLRATARKKRVPWTRW